jgi:hypothetical protein
MFLTVLYIFFGLAIIAMCVSVMRKAATRHIVKFIHRIKKIPRRVRRCGRRLLRRQKNKKRRSYFNTEEDVNERQQQKDVIIQQIKELREFKRVKSLKRKRHLIKLNFGRGKF